MVPCKYTLVNKYHGTRMFRLPLNIAFPASLLTAATAKEFKFDPNRFGFSI